MRADIDVATPDGDIRQRFVARAAHCGGGASKRDFIIQAASIDATTRKRLNGEGDTKAAPIVALNHAHITLRSQTDTRSEFSLRQAQFGAEVGNLHSPSFVIRNKTSREKVSYKGNDQFCGRFYTGNMAAPRHDWHLKQWLATLHARQKTIIERTGYPKSKVSKLVNGGQMYDRDTVHDIAVALNIEPYELLMHPDDAMRIRRLRETAISIAADQKPQVDAADAKTDLARNNKKSA
jgi:transcriptional regulator with XRE-family HTH domain